MIVRFAWESIAVPERYRGEPALDVDQCISCGLCVGICPSKALERVEVVKGYEQRYPLTYPMIDLGKCRRCGLCQDICPVGAIRMTKNVLLSAGDPSLLIKIPLLPEDRE